MVLRGSVLDSDGGARSGMMMVASSSVVAGIAMRCATVAKVKHRAGWRRYEWQGEGQAMLDTVMRRPVKV